MKKLTLFIFSLPLFGVYPQIKEDVINDKLEKVLSELDKGRSDLWETPSFLKSLISFLLQMNILFRILFILLIAGLLLYALWKISTLFIQERKPFKHLDNNKNELQISKTDEDYLSLARKEFRKGEYSHAIVLLHRGSVHNLYVKKALIYGRDYTNSEIFEILPDQTTSKAFNSLAKVAELITFKGKRSLENEYVQMEELYRRDLK